MLPAHHNQMAGENRVRVQLDIVISAFAALELEAGLLFGGILFAKEAFAGLDGLG